MPETVIHFILQPLTFNVIYFKGFPYDSEFGKIILNGYHNIYR